MTERSEQHRPRLRAVACRVLRSSSEADDAVQEASLRLPPPCQVVVGTPSHQHHRRTVVNPLEPWRLPLCGHGAPGLRYVSLVVDR
jgi:hypothetical protein